MKTVPQFGPTEEQAKEMEANELLGTFKLANLLYKNYRNSLIGALFTLSGVILGALTIFR